MSYSKSVIKKLLNTFLQKTTLIPLFNPRKMKEKLKKIGLILDLTTFQKFVDGINLKADVLESNSKYDETKPLQIIYKLYLW